MPEVWTPPTFDDITTSELVTAAYYNQLGNSLRFLKEVDYEQITSNASITATSEGTANQIVAASTLTYEAVPTLIEFFAVRYQAPATGMHLILRDSTTVIGRLVSVPASTSLSGVLAHRLTPTAASHTYNVAGYLDSAGTGTIHAGAGGASTPLPGFIRITRVPT